jgi:hypothetical protein
VASPDFIDGNLLPGTECDYIIYNIFVRNSVNDTLSETISRYDALSGYYLTMSGSYIVSLNANDIVTIKTKQNSDNEPANTPYSLYNFGEFCKNKIVPYYPNLIVLSMDNISLRGAFKK